MNVSVSALVNMAFSWSIVLLAIAGYVLTLRRTGEKWLFWIVLAVGWGFFALTHSLISVGVNAKSPVVFGFWLSSYTLIIYSMALLFHKLIRAR